jgi:hypothetical protein
MEQIKIQTPQLRTPKEAAQRLNVSVSYLAKARMKGTGPKFVRLGRAIRYTDAALDEHETAQTRTSTSQYPNPDNRSLPLKARSSRSKKRALSKELDLLDHLSSSIRVHQHPSSNR